MYAWLSIGANAVDFRELERQLSRSLRFQWLISRKGAGHVLLLDTNRKSHMDSPTAPSHLTLGDLVRSTVKAIETTLKAYIS